MLDPSGFDTPSTKQAAALLADWPGQVRGSVLVVLADEQARVALSFRNLERVSVLPPRASASPTWSAPPRLLVTREALDQLDARSAGWPTPPRRGLTWASQVLIRPVVSEKSYVLAANDKYTFRVHPTRTTADPPGGRGALRRQGRRGPHDVGQVQAQARG